jgi:competence protein ComEC
VFAISGLHIALVVGLVVQALRLLRVDRAWCGAVVIPVAWFYVAATGWQASAVRSAVMSSVLVCGWALNRPSDLLNTLAVSAVVILAWDPGQLFQPGFQLSFGVVAGMAIWGNVLERRWREWTSGAEARPDAGESIGCRWMQAVLRWLGLNLATSAAAWIASLPLCVHYFHLVSPSSLVANLIVVPLSSLCLVAGVASMVVAPFWGGLSEWFNQSAWFWMQWMMRAGVASAELPLAYLPVEAPPWGWWVGYVWIVFIVGPVWVRARTVDWRAAVPAVVWGLAAVVAWTSHVQSVRLVCLPWGAGVFVEPGRGPRVLFDVGSAAVARRVLPDWMKTRGLGRLDAGVACSGETRFAGGWPWLFETMGLRDWWMGPGNTPTLKKAHDAAMEKGIPTHRLVAGRPVEGWETLWPSADALGTRSDERALVLRGMPGGVSCVLMPSMNPEAQRAWLETTPKEMRARLLIVGLPSRGEPAIGEVLERLQPECVVVLTDERSARQRFAESTRRRLQRWAMEHGVSVWFTDESGAVTVTLRTPWWTGKVRSEWAVETMRPGGGNEGAAGLLENETDREQ